MMKKIRFEKAGKHHEKLIFGWLEEPHMKEFWDNSQEHKDDILNFIHGRKQHYFCGTTTYWVGYIEDQPFSFLLADKMLADQEDLSDIHRAYLSKTGHTIGLDFGIGNTKFLRRGLAAPTLIAFTKFFNEEIDPDADTFLIDPDENNPRAKHVYEKAGFKLVGDYVPSQGAFIGSTSYLMVKKLPLIRRALPEDAERIAFIHVTGWQQSYLGIVDDTYLEAISYEDRLDLRKSVLKSEVACFVAIIDGEIGGYCDAGPAREDGKARGEIYAIYLLEEFKSKGIGQALWERAVHHLKVQNLAPFKAWVLKDNVGARRFYKKQGGVVQDAKQVQIGNELYEELCYLFG